MQKNSNRKPLLLSLKPIYADLVFLGLKTAELRRRVSSSLQNRDVYVYVSSPVMELRGGFRVGEVWKDSPDNIWDLVSSFAKVDRATFDGYYEGSNVAYALEIKEVWKYRTALSLHDLRQKFENFVVPQSYRYLNEAEMRSIPRLKRRGISVPSPNTKAV